MTQIAKQKTVYYCSDCEERIIDNNCKCSKWENDSLDFPVNPIKKSIDNISNLKEVIPKLNECQEIMKKVFPIFKKYQKIDNLWQPFYENMYAIEEVFDNIEYEDYPSEKIEEVMDEVQNFLESYSHDDFYYVLSNNNKPIFAIAEMRKNVNALIELLKK